MENKILEEIKKYVSNESKFYNKDNNSIRLLSKSEIDNYKVELNINIDSIVPLFDLSDNEFIIYNKEKDMFQLLDISNNQIFKDLSNNEINEYLELLNSINNDIFVPLFNKKINVNCDSNVTDEYRKLCLEHLINISDKLVGELCIKIKEYYNNYSDIEEFKYLKDIDGIDILKHIDITNIDIDKPKENIPVIHLFGNCEWEVEHGIEICILGQEIIYVGEVIVYSPWGNDISNNTIIKKKKNPFLIIGIVFGIIVFSIAIFFIIMISKN